MAVSITNVGPANVKAIDVALLVVAVHHARSTADAGLAIPRRSRDGDTIVGVGPDGPGRDGDGGVCHEAGVVLHAFAASFGDQRGVAGPVDDCRNWGESILRGGTLASSARDKCHADQRIGEGDLSPRGVFRGLHLTDAGVIANPARGGAFGCGIKRLAQNIRACRTGGGRSESRIGICRGDIICGTGRVRYGTQRGSGRASHDRKIQLQRGRIRWVRPILVERVTVADVLLIDVRQHANHHALTPLGPSVESRRWCVRSTWIVWDIGNLAVVLRDRVVRHALEVAFKIQGRQSKLFQVVLALRPASRLTRLLDGWQQQSNQHRDDRDDDQQLNQRKATPRATRRTLLFRGFQLTISFKKQESDSFRFETRTTPTAGRMIVTQCLWNVSKL